MKAVRLSPPAKRGAGEARGSGKAERHHEAPRGGNAGKRRSWATVYRRGSHGGSGWRRRPEYDYGPRWC